MPDNIWYHDYQIVKVNPGIEIEDGMIADLGDLDEFQQFVKTVSFGKYIKREDAKNIMKNFLTLHSTYVKHRIPINITLIFLHRSLVCGQLLQSFVWQSFANRFARE